jgi:ABC-type sugar transport system permease subunit
MILPLHAWLTAFFENKIGYSAAISVLMCVILAAFGAGISFFRRDNE